MCKVFVGNEGGTAGLLPRPSKDEVFCLSLAGPICQATSSIGTGFFYLTVGAKEPATAR